jgi:alpha-tubulin suppressor-like RCC1 family protein
VELLSTPISWQAGQWILLTIDYDPSGIALVQGDQWVAQSTATLVIPPGTGVLALGSSLTGSSSASGVFEEFRSFAGPLDSAGLTLYYNAIEQRTVLGPISQAEIEAREQEIASAAAAGSLAGRVSQMAANGAFMLMDAGCDCATNGPVYFTNFTAMTSSNEANTTSFTIAGGDGLPYSIFMTTNLANSLAQGQWTFLGVGYTCNTYTFANQPLDQAFYALGQAQSTMVVGWGDDTVGQCDAPAGLTNVTAVAAAINHSLALKSDGTIVTWGLPDDAMDNVPTNVTGRACAVAAGPAHNVALLTNGLVVAWGGIPPSYGSITEATNVPPSATNIAAISTCSFHNLALRADGTLLGWGYYSPYNGELPVPDGLSNIVAIVAGPDHDLAVTSDGSVVAWGNNDSGQCDVPSELTNAVSVVSGWGYSVALKKDGTVFAWGDNTFGQTDVPPGLSSVIAIAAGGDPFPGNPYLDPFAETAYVLALKNDGTLVGWGNGPAAEVPVGMKGVIALAGGTYHGVAVRSGPPTPIVVLNPVSQCHVAGDTVIFTAAGWGIAGPVSYQWQFGGENIPGATSGLFILSNFGSSQEGSYRVVVSDANGSVASRDATLTLLTPPAITGFTQPTQQVAVFQSSLTFSVTATALAQALFPIGYQWQLNGTNLSGKTSSNYTFVVDNPTVGTYSVLVTNAAGSTSAVWQVTLTYEGSYIAPGTLAYHLSTNAVARTNGISDISISMNELSGWVWDYYYGTNMAHLTNTAWSTNFWLAGVPGLSATSIGFSNNWAAQGSVTMISPRHCIYAKHMHEPPGYFMAAFLDTNNVIHWRTNMENIVVAGDISVGILDSELPPSVGFLPVLPTNYTDYLPTNGRSVIQGIGRNQDVRMFGQPMTLGSTYVDWSAADTAPFGLTTTWNVVIRGGDSSNPEMLLIGDQLVVVSHNQAFNGGPSYASQLPMINQCMHYLSTNNNAVTDYQLTPFSLTNWPAISH